MEERASMDRRRLEEGFLLYAAVSVIKKHCLPIEVIPSERNDLAEVVAKQFHDAFVKKWGGKFIDFVKQCSEFKVPVVCDAKAKQL